MGLNTSGHIMLLLQNLQGLHFSTPKFCDNKSQINKQKKCPTEIFTSEIKLDRTYKIKQKLKWMGLQLQQGPETLMKMA